MNLLDETLNILRHESWLDYERIISFNNNNIQVGGSITHEINRSYTSFSKKFNCSTLVYECKFSSNNKTFAQAHNDLITMFDDLHNEFINNMNEHDRIRIVISHKSLERPISLPFLSKKSLTQQNLLSNFEHVAQSYKTVILNENNSLSAVVTIAHLPSGSGRKIINLKKKQKTYIKKKLIKSSEHFTELQKFCNLKPGIKNVYNSDNYCLLRAILIGKAFTDNDPDKNKLAEPNSTLLNRMVEKIIKELKIEDKPLGLEELKMIEMYLQDYQITLINGDGKLEKKPIYVGPLNKKFIYICYTESHYKVITSMKAFYNRQYFCKVA